MSITFAAEMNDSDIVGYRIECVCGGRSDRYNTYADAQAAYTLLPGYAANRPFLVHEGCDLDDDDRFSYRPAISVEFSSQSPEANFSSANGAEMLRILGLDPEPCGSVDAADLRGRIMLAQALAGGDPGRPTIVTDRDGGVTLVDANSPAPTAVVERARAFDCGRRAGYFDDRLIELSEVAQWAQDHDRQVQWN
ncbi:hypothetical protein [Gordonia otitidis]|uniref:Uncharacterized protein n=1 Tax=Gordonia otitidis (strain DSM 44809 / CCUG 52243 / JCM 12355 / NBRC 100426 / IFM 10032) TaxID=1108044 RepID=H5TSL7_GORO1|nr:hypothetical protein [Gordonia otitidis]GAB36475.1 hypothetical protein GOOTI_221_00180 [Gordonia otitidis NBRC 100426]